MQIGVNARDLQVIAHTHNLTRKHTRRHLQKHLIGWEIGKAFMDLPLVHLCVYVQVRVYVCVCVFVDKENSCAIQLAWNSDMRATFAKHTHT